MLATCRLKATVLTSLEKDLVFLLVLDSFRSLAYYWDVFLTCEKEEKRSIEGKYPFTTWLY
jgi:hypothetical protein